MGPQLVNRVGSCQGKTKCIPTTSTNSDPLLPPLKIWRTLEKMKLNEPERQILGRYRSPVSRHSIRSYILTYCRLKKWEPLIAPCMAPTMGPLISASAVPHCGVGTDLDTLAWLEQVIANCEVAT